MRGEGVSDSGAGANVTDAILAVAHRAPDSIAVIEDDRSLTYRQLDAAVRRAGAQFAAAGWNAGSVVGTAFAGAGLAVQLVACLALARRGVTQLPLNSSAGAAGSPAEMLARHDAAGVLTDASVPAGGLPILRPGRWLAEDTPAPAWDAPAVGADAPRIILHTSGTTGTPKAMVLTHAQEIARIRLASGFSALYPDDRLMSLVWPNFYSAMFHMLRCLAAGACVVARPRDRALGPALAMARRHAVTYLNCTPSHVHDLLHGLLDDAPPLDSLRVLRVSTAALAPELLRRARRLLTPHIHVSYGCNEGGVIALATADILARQPLSVGRVVEGVEMEVVDADGRPLPPGAVGEVRIRSPGLVQGYLHNPEATRLRFRDGWYYPGDAALIDSEGLVFLKGRTDELLNFDGVLVAPQEIESALLEHPAVLEAAAFAMPSARFQDLPCAAVVLREPVSAQILGRHCQARIGWRTPRMILPVRALPRNAMGKVLRRVLSEKAVELAKAAQAAGSVASAKPAEA